jgi:hypothetical protein
MSYEIPLPMSEQLQKKPIKNATELHKYLERNEIKPLSVVVDNANARVRVYFEGEIGAEERKKLSEAVMEFYRKHIGVEK